MIKFDYMDQRELKEKLLLAEDRCLYEETVDKKDWNMLKLFDDLNPKRTTKQNIECFFEVLYELMEYIK